MSSLRHRWSTTHKHAQLGTTPVKAQQGRAPVPGPGAGFQDTGDGKGKSTPTSV